MRLRLKFGDREFEIEDPSVHDYDELMKLGNLGRRLLLERGQRDDGEDEVIDLTTETRLAVGFRGSETDEEDEDE